MHPAAGWYPDPHAAEFDRYWDGEQWTDRTRATGSDPDSPVSDTSARDLGVQDGQRVKKRRWWMWVVGIVGAFIVGSVVAGALGAFPDPRDPNGLVPNVVGSSLDDAKSALREVGLKVESEDDTGQGRQVWNSGNWVATRQSPAAGERVGDTRTVVVGVIKHGEEPKNLEVEAMIASPTSIAEQAPSSANPVPNPSTSPSDPPAPAPAPAPVAPAEDPQAVQSAIEDAAFIASLGLVGVDYGGDKAQAIAAGRTTCKYIDNAASPALAVLTSVQTAQQAGYTRHDAESLVGSAIGAFCDEYAYLVAN